MSDFKSDFSKLNPAQQAAVTDLNGALLVLAGAGSGKTRVITQKIAYLIQNAGLNAAHIAALTFTNKAAREMLERVGQILPAKACKGLTVCTFHALGLDILRHEAKSLGYKKQFSVLDAHDSRRILGDIVPNFSDKNDINHLQQQISRWKNAQISPENAKKYAQNDTEQQHAQIFAQYQNSLHAYQAVDFDDLIRLPVLLFQDHPDILARWQGRLRYLLIDEYQDTNGAQYALLRQLAGVRAQFTAVGDDDQSIYAWRGADLNNMRRLQDDFPKLKIIKLEQNYRSSARILTAANHVIAHNPKLFDKRLWSEFGLGDPIKVMRFQNEEAEAAGVVDKLMAHKNEQQTRFSDYAILYRSNYQSRLIEQALRNQKIPYQVSGGQSFFDLAEIKDVLAWLRILSNENDDPACIRAMTTPKRGIGSGTLEKLGQYAALREISLLSAADSPSFALQVSEEINQNLSLFCQFISRMRERAQKEDAGLVLHDLLVAIDYERWLIDSEEHFKNAEKKWKNVQEFCQWIDKKGKADDKNLIQLTQTITLMSLLEGRNQDEAPDSVQLSTLHAAKGLEYPHVFLIGCVEGILPHDESIQMENIEEERRLMYVGITRAQRSLSISHYQKRKKSGDDLDCEPSRFIEEMQDNDIIYSGCDKAKPISREEGKARLARLGLMLAAKSKTKPSFPTPDL